MDSKENIIYTLKFAIISIIIVMIIFVISFTFKICLDKRNADTSATVSTKSDDIILVIDAGHGGEDAGACANDGTYEKDLNLEISKLVKVLCDLNGTKAVMTREEDILLYDYYNDLNDYTGNKKLYDLKNRVKITKEYENAIYLGIHMNKFPQSKYYGTQVYYSKNNSTSDDFAKAVQSSVKLYLQPSNRRQIKQADSSIYVLNSLDCPAILVECGFLSNPDELELLKNEQYQAKLSLLLFTSALSFTQIDN